ncbi:MAG: hypothetical protein GYB65_17635 [Chloroflexi bacterium]|nr:hypothetical protein [Chloroflexota bacterium]
MQVIVFLVILVVFIAFLFSLFAVAEGRNRRVPGWSRSIVSTPKLTHAAQIAMQRAGYTPGEDFVQATDLGLLAYRSTDEPRLVRYGDVLVDTRYLRPFVELWLPHDARGTVRFEILDEKERLRYADEEKYDLVRGKNTLLPNTWLPLEGKAQNGQRWTLRVLASSTLLAKHTFGWQGVGGGRVQELADDDGELSPELLYAIQNQSGPGISLSELLSDQEDWS